MTEAHLAADRRAMRPWASGSLFALLLVLIIGLSPAVAATGEPGQGRARTTGRAAAGRTQATSPRGASGLRSLAQPMRAWVGLSGLFTTQLDGSAYSSGNCNMASAAMLFEVQTGRTMSGAQMRRLSGARTPGTTLADLRRAFRRLGQSVVTREDMPWGSFVREVRSGRSAVVMGWYANLPRSVDLQPGFNGAHSVFVLGYAPHIFGRNGGFYVMDPLGQGQYDGQWWSARTLRRFGWSGRPHHVGVGRKAFYGNVALQLTPTYKGRMNAKRFRPTFQSYWDTSKALMRHANQVTVVPRRQAKGSLILRISDRKLRMSVRQARRSKLASPLSDWKRQKRDAYVAHQRLVVRASVGARVVAAASGRVAYRGWDSSGERMLWIKHGPRLYTVYKGLGSVYVEPGQWVRKGRILGHLAVKEKKVKAGKRTKVVRSSKLYFVVAAGDPRQARSRQNPNAFLRK